MRSKKALYNISTNLLLQIVIIIYGLIVPKIIISCYGSSVNGLISSITQFLAYIALLDSGFTSVVKSQLYKPIAKKNNRDISLILKSSKIFFRRIAYIFIIYIVLLAFLYPYLVNNSFDYYFTFGLIFIISLSSFAEYYFGMVYKLFLQADQKSYVISLIQIVVYCLTIIVTIVAAKLNVSITILKLLTAIIFILRPLLQSIYVKKHYSFDLKINGNYKINNKWDGLAQHIASVIHGNTDITLLTIFTSLAEVSVYSVYYLVVNSIKSLINSFAKGIDSSFGDMIAKKEINNLNKKFSMYEVIYNTICTIAFSSTIILIVPFVSLYTKGVNDANYIRYLFGVLLVISEYIWAVRLPYSSITLAAGHFKETRKGAWVECFSNIIISIIFVKKYGLVGVTIGTIISMIIRTIEFVYHANKYILNRTVWCSVKKIFFLIFETLIIILISNYIPLLSYTNFMNWLLNASMIVVLSSIITIVFNITFFYKDYQILCTMVKGLLRRKYDK